MCGIKIPLQDITLKMQGGGLCARGGVFAGHYGTGIMSQIKRVCRRVRDTEIEESRPDRLVNPHYGDDDGNVPMANNGERFSEQTYSSINHGENSL